MPVHSPAHVLRGARIRLAMAAALVVTILLVLLSGCSAATGKALPKGFPTSAVPLADGTVTKAATAGVAWNVTVDVADAAAQKASLEALKKKGFTVIGTASSSDSSTAYSLASADYSIRLGFEKSKDGYSVTYGVAPRSRSGATSTPTPDK